MEIDELIAKIDDKKTSKQLMLDQVDADILSASSRVVDVLLERRRSLSSAIADLNDLRGEALCVKRGMQECVAQLSDSAKPTGPMYKITMTEYDWGAQHEMGTKIVYSEEEAKRFCEGYAGGSSECYYRASYVKVL